MNLPVPAHQWFLPGDHPEDGAPPGGEGRVVRYFRHPDYSGADRCPVCHDLIHHHGWIDTGDDGHTVCPGAWILTTADGRHLPLSTDALFALCKELTA